jgi:hypothetical protein
MQGGNVVKWDMNASQKNIHKGYILIKPKGGGYVQKLYVEKKGFVWMGNVAGRVYKYDPFTNKEVDHITKDDPKQRKLTTIVYMIFCNMMIRYCLLQRAR